MKNRKMTREQLKENIQLKLFRNLIDQSNDAIFIIDPLNGRFLDVNKKACNSLGYSRKYLLTKTVVDIDARIPSIRTWKKHVKEVRRKGNLVLVGRHIRRDNTKFDVEINVKYIKQDNEYYLVAIVRDITELRQAEKKIQLIAEEWDKTFNSVTDYVFIQNKDFVITNVNKAMAKVLKMKPKDIIGKKCYQVLHKRKKPWPNCPYEKTRNDRKPHTEQVIDQVIGLPLLVTTSPLFNDNGELIGSVHIAKNITKVKETEANLRKLAAIVETTQDAIITKSVSGIIQSWNAAAEKMYGYKASEAIGKSIMIIVPPDKREELKRILNDIKKGKTILSFETVRVHKNKKKINASLTISPLKDEYGVIFGTSVIGRDITLYKRMEDNLRENKEKYQMLAENLRDVVLTVSLTGKLLYCSPAIKEFGGYDPGKEIGNNIKKYFANPKEFIKGIRLIKDIAIKKQSAVYEFMYKQKKGDPFYVEVSGKPLIKNNKITAIHCVMRDISIRKEIERVQKMYSDDLEKMNDKIRNAMNIVQEKDQKLLDTTEELRNTNENLMEAKDELEKTLDQVKEQRNIILKERNRLNAIVEEMGEGVMVIDDNKEVVLMNNRTKEILGYKRDEEISENYKKLFVLKLWKEIYENKQEIVKKEIVIDRPRKAVLLVSIARLPVLQYDKKQNLKFSGLVAVIRDITFEKQVERMKSDFVANVSHEIRSPMAPMKDALGLVLDGTAGSLNDQQKKFLTVLDNNMDRLLRLINDLLDLSKIEAGKMELRKEKVNINEILEEVKQPMSVYSERKNINLFFNLEKDIPKVQCDKDRITQVIINLITNAVKYTPEDGSITVTSQLADDPQKNNVVVAIKDTGPGLSKEEADLLFDRFKQIVSPEAIKGTGLGLSISRSIIEMHKGRIWVESEKGKGSTFKFTLPVG